MTSRLSIAVLLQYTVVVYIERTGTAAAATAAAAAAAVCRYMIYVDINSRVMMIPPVGGCTPRGEQQSSSRGSINLVRASCCRYSYGL